MTIINPFTAVSGVGWPNRIHVNRAAHWTRSAGTDWWYREQEAGTAADDLITNYGWTTTALSYTVGSAADLLTTADVGPTVTVFDAANDLLLSPLLFGEYAHGAMAGSLLGYSPSKLCLEAFANFGTATANETTTGFGFSTGTGLTATNHVAFIHSNSANFAIRGTDGTGALTDTGAAVDNSYHLWKITMTAGGSVEWFIDTVSQGTITLKTDMYPTGFSANATTTNRINLAWAHVWYE